MFGIGMPELLLILAVALIVIGPKKLPDLAKSLGRAMGEFKRATNDLKQSIEQETGLGDVRQSMDEVKRDIRQSLDPIDIQPVKAASENAVDTQDTPSAEDTPTPEDMGAGVVADDQETPVADMPAQSKEDEAR